MRRRGIEKVKKAAALLLAAALTAGVFTGCAGKPKKAKLDPNNPVTLTLWHYYNGAQQAAFDELVSDFNSTRGKEIGIYVEGYSRGSVADLEQAITGALEGKVGADELPDIFSTYADTAYSVEKEGKLANLSQYFTETELGEYVDSYIKEGYFHDNGALYLFPVAKSTETMMMNMTDWEPFAEATGSTLQELETLEGVVEVAKRYYEWTDAETPDIPNDGKAFYGRDSMSNYFIINMMQMGTEIFSVQDGSVTIQADKDKIRRLWDNYYVPYVNGYFASYGKFRSDDVKTGDLLAYTGSSSSSTYFPDHVTVEEKEYPIDYIVLPVPMMEGGKQVLVQQGAGMAVTKSDEQHEYAAAEFLKWFTEKENNFRFACGSSYLPVKKDANNVLAMDAAIASGGIEVNKKAYDCLAEVMSHIDSSEFYCIKCFDNSYAARKVLDYDLSDKAVADKEEIDALIASGTDREKAIAPYVSDEAFDAWYDAFCTKLEEKTK